MSRIDRQRKIDLILKTLNNEAQITTGGIITFEPVVITDHGKYFSRDGKEIKDFAAYCQHLTTEAVIVLPDNGR
nr:hypothetical protein [uncultured Draconibacterium sp.]